MIAVFDLRCYARARLAAEGMLDFYDAVDILQRWADSSGLTDAVGIDTVQSIMAAAFSKFAGHADG